MTKRIQTIISSEEFAQIKLQKATQDKFNEPQIDGPELIVGQRYLLTSLDLIKVKSIDKKGDTLHIFNYTQQCNTYPKLSTFRVKSFA